MCRNQYKHVYNTHPHDTHTHNHIIKRQAISSRYGECHTEYISFSLRSINCFVHINESVYSGRILLARVRFLSYIKLHPPSHIVVPHWRQYKRHQKKSNPSMGTTWWEKIESNWKIGVYKYMYIGVYMSISVHSYSWIRSFLPLHVLHTKQRIQQAHTYSERKGFILLTLCETCLCVRIHSLALYISISFAAVSLLVIGNIKSNQPLCDCVLFYWYEHRLHVFLSVFRSFSSCAWLVFYPFGYCRRSGLQ